MRLGPEQVARKHMEKGRGGRGKFRAEAWRAPQPSGGTC